MTTVRYTSLIEVPVEELYEFHADVRNLGRISPKFPAFELLSEPGPTAVGDLQRFRLSAGRFGFVWEARVTRLVENRLLEDVQEAGPFRSWRHQHQFAAEGNSSRLTDVVAFRMIPTAVGEFLEYFFVRPFVVGMFRQRHAVTRRVLERTSEQSD